MLRGSSEETAFVELRFYGAPLSLLRAWRGLSEASLQWTATARSFYGVTPHLFSSSLTKIVLSSHVHIFALFMIASFRGLCLARRVSLRTPQCAVPGVFPCSVNRAAVDVVNCMQSENSLTT